MKSEQAQIAEQAAKWILKLSTGQCSDSDLVMLEQWKQQSPAHQRAFEQLQGLLKNLQSLQQHQINSDHPIIQQQIINKKSKLAKQTSALLLLLGVFAAIYALPWQSWTADVQNTQQAWQQQRLSDSSVIIAAGKTAYNIDYSKTQRRIELLHGNILVDVAKDAQRPFIVDTGATQIQALGTRFIVQQYDGLTIVSMLESKTQIQPAKDAQRIILETGQSLYLSPDQIKIEPNQPSSLNIAWQSKKLVVNNMPLDQVLEILQSYQSRHFVYAKQHLNRIHVTAVLPLDQPDVALQLLQQHSGLQIQHYGKLITHIAKQ